MTVRTNTVWRYSIKEDTSITAVFYDVRAYYSIEGTTADPNYVDVYASKTNPNKKKPGSNLEQKPVAEEQNTSEDKPTGYSIQNFPNPCNPSTTFSIQVPFSNRVQLKIYDQIGREVATLVDGILSQGTYNIKFDGTNLSSGIYMYRMISGNFNKLGKIMLLK